MHGFIDSPQHHSIQTPMPMRTLLFTFTVLLLAGIAAHAQESSVPVDSAGRLDRIDTELEAKLGLFPEISTFREARVFQSDSATFILQVTYHAGSQLMQRRTTLTLSQLHAFRQRVADSIAARATQIALDQDGRAGLLVATTAISLGYYGTAITVAADMDDGRTVVGTYMLAGATGFFLPYLLTNNRPVRAADGSLATSGMVLGAGHGFAASLLVNGQDNSPEAALGWSVPFSIAEGVAGYMIADGYQLSHGKAAMIANGGVLGFGVGSGVAFLADLYDRGDERAVGALMLGGSAGGFLLGNAMANAQPYTAGDASVVGATALLGGFVPLFFAELIDPDGDNTDGKIHVGGVMLGATGGMLIGGELVRGKDFTNSQATYIGLGEAAGGLLGLGISYLLASENGAGNISAYLGASSAGAVGGYALLYNLMSPQARTRSDREGDEKDGFLYDFQVSPSGLATLFSGNDIPEKMVVPLASFSCRW